MRFDKQKKAAFKIKISPWQLSGIQEGRRKINTFTKIQSRIQWTCQANKYFTWHMRQEDEIKKWWTSLLATMTRAQSFRLHNGKWISPMTLSNTWSSPQNKRISLTVNLYDKSYVYNVLWTIQRQSAEHTTGRLLIPCCFLIVLDLFPHHLQGNNWKAYNWKSTSF